MRTTINKIQRLSQGNRPASAYATNFHLLAYDMPWDEETIMNLFRYGLRNDGKDFLVGV
jgi:hypothetical protein